MAKINKNPHKARNRKNKIKSRVRAFRERNKILNLAPPVEQINKEAERIENINNVESFLKAVGDENNWTFDVIDEMIVRLRFDYLNGTKTYLRPSFEDSLED